MLCLKVIPPSDLFRPSSPTLDGTGIVDRKEKTEFVSAPGPRVLGEVRGVLVSPGGRTVSSGLKRTDRCRLWWSSCFGAVVKHNPIFVYGVRHRYSF